MYGQCTKIVGAIAVVRKAARKMATSDVFTIATVELTVHRSTTIPLKNRKRAAWSKTARPMII